MGDQEKYAPSDKGDRFETTEPDEEVVAHKLSPPDDTYDRLRTSEPGDDVEAHKV